MTSKVKLIISLIGAALAAALILTICIVARVAKVRKEKIEELETQLFSKQQSIESLLKLMELNKLNEERRKKEHDLVKKNPNNINFVIDDFNKYGIDKLSNISTDPNIADGSAATAPKNTRKTDKLGSDRPKRKNKSIGKSKLNSSGKSD